MGLNEPQATEMIGESALSSSIRLQKQMGEDKTIWALSGVHRRKRKYLKSSK
jgi:hypothetical protein